MPTFGPRAEAGVQYMDDASKHGIPTCMHIRRNSFFWLWQRLRDRVSVTAHPDASIVTSPFQGATAFVYTNFSHLDCQVHGQFRCCTYARDKHGYIGPADQLAGITNIAAKLDKHSAYGRQ